MAEKIGDAVRNILANAFAALFNGGILQIYTGTQPVSADTTPPGILLITINLPNPAFGAAVAGVAPMAGVWQGTTIAAGTAGWFRMKTAGGTDPTDGTVTPTGGGGEIELATVDILVGRIITIVTFTVTQPAN